MSKLRIVPPNGNAKKYLNHHEVVIGYSKNPSLVEQGLRVLETEFRFGKCRIDIIGKDTQNTIVIIGVNRYNIAKGIRHIKSCHEQLLRVFGLFGIIIPIRALVVTGKKVIDLGVQTSNPANYANNPGLPSSREIFGLKGRVMK